MSRRELAKIAQEVQEIKSEISKLGAKAKFFPIRYGNWIYLATPEQKKAISVMPKGKELDFDTDRTWVWRKEGRSGGKAWDTMSDRLRQAGFKQKVSKTKPIDYEGREVISVYWENSQGDKVYEEENSGWGLGSSTFKVTLILAEPLLEDPSDPNLAFHNMWKAGLDFPEGWVPWSVPGSARFNSVPEKYNPAKIEWDPKKQLLWVKWYPVYDNRVKLWAEGIEFEESVPLNPITKEDFEKGIAELTEKLKVFIKQHDWEALI